MKGAWASLRLIGQMAWRQGRGHALIAMLETAGRVLEYLLPLFAGLIVTGVVTHSPATALVGGAGLAMSQGFAYLMAVTGVESRLTLMERIGHAFDLRTGRLAGETPTLDHLEDPRHRDQTQALAERLGVLGGSYNLLVNVANNLAGPIVTVLVAAYADWRLLLLLLVAMPAAVLARATVRWEGSAEDEGAEEGRRSHHLLEVATSPTPSSELRVLGARRWAVSLVAEHARRWRAPHVRSATRASAWSVALAAVYLGCAAVLLVWMVRDTLAGRTDPGRLVTGVMVIGQIREAVSALQWAIRGLAQALRAAGRYRWLEDYAADVAAAHSGSAVPPDRLATGIRLEGARFRYPGADHDSLGPLDLELPAGAVIAVVGENGAGKSTLVKLLTGMYDLAAGRVVVDGVDLREMDLAAWRARCSGAFQDHARLETTARETVGLGEGDVLGHSDTDARIGRALEDAAAEDVLQALPQGLDTQLGSAWPGGVDLSGGQWQRLAVARGMMRRDPLLLVLDEPTSALDPATEHELFERYARAGRSAGHGGGVTLLVTHRFSTVAAADLVVVLAGGRVAEVGTHAELMTANGRYAELYGLQAAGYR